MTTRFALYYVPPDGSPLDDLGRRWFGRDAAGHGVSGRLELPGFPAERLAQLTERPRRYGLHATLAAPMRLAPGRTPTALLQAARVFARRHAAVTVPPLTLGIIDRFLALMPQPASPALDGLAAAAVTAFAPFRAPPTAAELARRRGTGLSARQQVLLRHWGYPFVLDEFRFHLTLTDRVDGDDERQALFAALVPLVADACGAPCVVDAISVCRQDGLDAPFRQHRRFPLRGVRVSGAAAAATLS